MFNSGFGSFPGARISQRCTFCTLGTITVTQSRMCDSCNGLGFDKKGSPCLKFGCTRGRVESKTTRTCMNCFGRGFLN